MYSVVRSLVIIALVASFIEASHFRYGTVSFTKNPSNPRSVTLKFDLAMRRSFFGAPSTGASVFPGTLIYGSNYNSPAFVISNADISNDIIYASATWTLSLPVGSSYIYFSSNARISNLNNNANGNFNFGATVVLTASEVALTTPINNSPVSGLLPVLPVPLNSVPFYYDITASDPENDALTYRLSNTVEMQGSNPPGLSTNNAGRVTLSQRLAAGFWSTQQVISDTYGQNVAVDYLLNVVPVVSYCNGPCGNTASCSTNAGCVACGSCVPATPAIVTAAIGSATYPQTNLPAPRDGDVIFVQTGQTITVSFVAYDINFPFGSRIVMYTSGVSTFVSVAPQAACDSSRGCTFVGNYTNPQLLQFTATPPLSANGTQSTICIGVTSNGNALPYSQHCVTLAISAPTSVCGNGIVETNEQCDGGACCESNCQLASTATVCRASAGDCDVAETCDGSSDSCPADSFVAANTVCRASAGDCDVAETCDGSSTSCPADSFVAANTVCRLSAGDCDITEVCSGSSNSCPADSVIAANTVCRASAGDCDVAETCDGSATSCPADSVVAANTVCRASAGDCDVAETCDGSAYSCPADSVVAANTVCRASAGDCDVDEVCDGSATSCPVDAFVASTTVCRASAGDCDVAESCTGSDAACPADAFASSATVCRAANGVCDAAESCTGSDAACPANAAAPTTTVCRPQNGSCDVAERCDGTSFSCPIDRVANTTYCQSAALVCPRVSNTASSNSEWYCSSVNRAVYFQCYTQQANGQTYATYTNMPCPAGTRCNCGYGEECSCGGTQSPCTNTGEAPVC